MASSSVSVSFTCHIYSKKCPVDRATAIDYAFVSCITKPLPWDIVCVFVCVCVCVCVIGRVPDRI